MLNCGEAEWLLFADTEYAEGRLEGKKEGFWLADTALLDTLPLT